MNKKKAEKIKEYKKEKLVPAGLFNIEPFSFIHLRYKSQSVGRRRIAGLTYSTLTHYTCLSYALSYNHTIRSTYP